LNFEYQQSFRMVFAPIFLSLAFAPLVFGQSNNTALGIEAIEAHFTNAGLVPALLPTFDPLALLDVSYPGIGDISPGQAFEKTQVGPTPTVQVIPANSTVQLTGSFTLIMADAGPVGADQSEGQTRHWLVNGVTLTGNPLAVENSTATAITPYAGPWPAAGSGAHRYVILLYTQPSTFVAPEGLNTPNVPVSVFNLGDYVKNSGLGPLVGATYITVEEGTASVAPSSTAPVVTSTLPAAHSTSGASSGSSHATGTGTASSGAPSGTASSNQPSGAIGNFVSIKNVVLAGIFGLFMI
jgi:hypothetical protein